MTDFESNLNIKHISSTLLTVAGNRGMLLKNVLEVADREIDGSPNCEFQWISTFKFVTPIYQHIILYSVGTLPSPKALRC
jgi:hypothetical protein